jgi:hypothetical protein
MIYYSTVNNKSKPIAKLRVLITTKMLPTFLNLGTHSNDALVLASSYHDAHMIHSRVNNKSKPIAKNRVLITVKMIAYFYFSILHLQNIHFSISILVVTAIAIWQYEQRKQAVFFLFFLATNNVATCKIWIS